MPQSFSPEQIDAIIKGRHPTYDEHLPHWKFCEAAYRGGRAFISSENLFQFYKEGPEEYKQRRNRAHRANHTKRVADTVTQYLFKQLPRRDKEKAPDWLQDMWARMTKDGKDADRFARELDQWLSVFGRMYVVVDRKDIPADTRREDFENQPYAYMVSPIQVLNMSWSEDDGKLSWILIAEDHRDDKTPDASGEIIARFRLWTRDAWYLFGKRSKDDERAEQLDAADHDLGEVPVHVVQAEEGGPWDAPALIGDIVYMDRALMNYGSMLDEIVYEQTFSQLTMPVESMVPGSTEEGNIVAASTKRVLLYSAVSPGSKPEFIAPDPKQAGLLLDASQTLMRNIYAITGTDNDANSQSMSTGKSYASGKVRQFDHTAIENLLLGKAQACERAEEAIARLAGLWLSADEDVDEAWIAYPTTFDIRGLEADLELAKGLFEVTSPVEVMRAHMRNMVPKLFPRATQAEKDKILADIATWEPEYSVLAAQKDKELEQGDRDLDQEDEKIDQGQQQVDNQSDQIENSRKQGEGQLKLGNKIADKPTPKPAPKGK